MSENADSYARGSRSSFRRIRAGAVIAVALLAGFLVWLLVVRDDDSNSSPGTTTTSAPRRTGPDYTCRPADAGECSRPPDLLGRPKERRKLRAHEDRRQPGLHSLFAEGRCERQLRPLSDDRHLPASRCVRGDQAAGPAGGICEGRNWGRRCRVLQRRVSDERVLRVSEVGLPDRGL